MQFVCGIDVRQLANSDGTTDDGKEYVDLSWLLDNDLLGPGEGIRTRIYFNNPRRARFTFESSVRGMITDSAYLQ